DPAALEPQTVVQTTGGERLINGSATGQLRPVGDVVKLPGDMKETGPVGPLQFFSVISQSEIVLWRSSTTTDDQGTKTVTYQPEVTSGEEVLRPGKSPTFRGIRGDALYPKIDFLSLMLALFCG